MATDIRLREQLPELTKKIVQTYSEEGSINHLGHCPLPNYDVIIACCEDLKEIIYPGFRRREGLHMGNVLYHVGDLIDSLHDKLTVQFGRALRHDAGASEMCTRRGRHRSMGQVKTVQFLEKIPEIRKMLAPGRAGCFRRRPSHAHRRRSHLLLPGARGDLPDPSAWPTRCTRWACRMSRG